ncbi:MAG: D-arabinose 5-phosphate isomerase [Flavobacteriaceae bacterium CG_4_8_14_3_um_filter_34_10]|nr:KpsF/GutQ family sugar-phosphate isomerase [Flavobacteriia bacterium]OIP48984.1 MAG: D-arabinose 5-phosphate isomerase [Flavobacteriaceae bacterium CG2_30_34_30]PIQ18487.1 MAG: D-arabinose 5-phosphate isomerase [Flavobacteriaceae bacterium CG18_big_fil_WC_8_21_14_2_50_34_36]PIV49943.1 MAG: D-arabinose 5-phosphate isomerase [Flavobacteriaceae bacterium CG02_land_8_20_14_3_00_34_13]PIX10017.1 MAG: D-arabinose 5-phosphate isomerase [Flavobacteriaceae bacterium CG_4_8_14_3_um_filter_34_10]PIZ07
MQNNQKIISLAKKTIEIESKAIGYLADLVDDEFANAVNYVFHSKSRIIITGIGKSANIATKIVATLNSTGTPAGFMHAADAIHGDLGTIQPEDVVICISKSGNTPEIKVLVPLIKSLGNKLIAITSNKESFLGTHADYVLNAYVEKEACPNNLAPTTSTTAQLVIGDAFAVCLLDLRGFSSKDFARFHPGGSLGKQLYLRVNDLSSTNLKPMVSPDADIKEVIVEISEKMLGVTAVVENNRIIGIITDGDLRRMLSKTDTISGLKAKDIMTENPKQIASDAMAMQAMEMMNTFGITQLLVEKNNTYEGVIHLHNLIKEGII